MLDSANRLPGVLKQRYLDYLNKEGFSLNQPGFESLREFVVYELNVMTSDYAQSFFKSDEKDRASEAGNEHIALRVRQAALNRKLSGARSVETVGESSRSCNKTDSTKLPPVCFVCNDPCSKHFLPIVNCLKAKLLSKSAKLLLMLLDVLIVFLWDISLENVLLRRNVVYADRILALSILPLYMNYMLIQTRYTLGPPDFGDSRCWEKNRQTLNKQL